MSQWESFYETCHRSEHKLKQVKVGADRVKTEKQGDFSNIQDDGDDVSSNDESNADDEFFALCVSSIAHIEVDMYYQIFITFRRRRWIVNSSS